VTAAIADLVSAVDVVGIAYPGTELLDVPNRKLIRIPALSMNGVWTPARVRGLLVCDNWPDQRPQLLIGDELRRNGQEPPNFSRQLIEAEAWFGFSFNAPYSASHPALIPVIRGWLRRFDGRAD
jgi:hypothetical protein